MFLPGHVIASSSLFRPLLKLAIDPLLVYHDTQRHQSRSIVPVATAHTWTCCDGREEDVMLPPTIRVLFADNHQATRDGIEISLTNAARIEFVGAAHDFADVLQRLSTARPDVVVLDILGMCESPIDMVRYMRREYPNVRVVLYSSTMALAPEMLHAGAHGYVTKDEYTDQLIEAIYAVYAGQTFLSPMVQDHMDSYILCVTKFHLTQREREMLTLVAQGLGTEAMAEILNIDPRSVNNCVSRIRKKTGCKTRIDLANWARRYIGEPVPTMVT
jgi:DNA-binding NarL/FixJ family response regulator